MDDEKTCKDAFHVTDEIGAFVRQLWWDENKDDVINALLLDIDQKSDKVSRTHPGISGMILELITLRCETYALKKALIGYALRALRRFIGKGIFSIYQVEVPAVFIYPRPKRKV